MTDRSRLSVFITTYNNGRTLTACLDSIQWADEIVVLDSFSTDDTLAIAQRYGAKIAQHKFMGYGAQKRMALAMTTHNWVLLLDADEALSPGLQAEIRQLLQDGPGMDGYEIPRQEQMFWRMYNPATRMNYYLRLFDKRRGGIDDVPIHAAPKVQGRIARLKAPFYHYGETDIHTKVEKINAYSTGLVVGQAQEAALGHSADHGVLPAAVLHSQLSVQAQFSQRLGGIHQLGDRGVLRLSQIRQAVRTSPVRQVRHPVTAGRCAATAQRASALS